MRGQKRVLDTLELKLIPAPGHHVDVETQNQVLLNIVHFLQLNKQVFKAYLFPIGI